MRSIFRLQDLVMKHYRFTVLLFLVGITPFMLYGNYLTPLKSVITKDAVMNIYNFVRQMDIYVTDRQKDGFRVDEPVVISKKFPQGIRSVENLREILNFHNFLKREFNKRRLDSDRLVSLAVMPRFVDTGIELAGDPYINPAMLKDSTLTIEGWKKWVREDRTVYGKYVSRDFKTALFFFYVPDEEEQIGLAWKIKSVLEQKEFGWIDRFLETDIHPVFENVGISGWIMGRWVIGQLAIINILAITICTTLLTLPGFRRALDSWIQASVCLIIIFLSIIWTRGAVGLLAWAGSEVGESPYLLFSYAICILQGVSFPLQMFVAYNLLIKRRISPEQSWREVIGSIGWLISLVVTISIGSFISLWWSFGVRPIVDMAIASSIGLATLWIFSRYFLPTLYILLESQKEKFQKIGEVFKKTEAWSAGWYRQPRFELGWPIKLTCWLLIKTIWLIGWTFMKIEAALGYIFVETTLKVILRVNTLLLAKKNVAPAAVSIVILLVVLTGWAVHEIIWPNHNLIANSKPLEFTPGRITERTAQELNREGQIGFDGLNFLIEPKPSWATREGVYEPKFLVMAHQIEKGISRFPKEIGAREIFTVVQGIERISLQSLHKLLPETKEEAAFCFRQIQSKLKTVIMEELFFHNGIRMTVTCSADDANNMGRLRDAVIAYVQKNFPELQIHAFGRANAYPEVDREIIIGKPWNIAGDQGQIYVWFLLWLTIIWLKRNRRLPAIRPGWGALILNIPTWFSTVVLSIIMIHHLEMTVPIPIPFLGWYWYKWAYGPIPLDLANAVISAFSINATSDFSFHFLKAFIEELKERGGREAMLEVLRHHSRTIVEDAFLNSRVFLPLYFSSFIPISRIGTMMVLMLALCLIGILILVPPLLVVAVKERRIDKSLTIKNIPVFEGMELSEAD